MKNRMRLLIAHDATNRFNETLDDLRWAGLQRDATARVLSGVQIMVPTPEAMIGNNQTFIRLESEVEETVKRSCRRLQEIFPEWEIQGLTATGPLTLEALDHAEEWNPDLIVVGADSRSLFERLFSGGVSSVLVQKAPGSVRVARGRANRAGPQERFKRDEPHTRLLIGVDGSEYAEAAVREVAVRDWPAGAKARLVTAIGPFFNLPTDLLEAELDRARFIQQKHVEALRAAGLDVSQVVREEDAAQLILSEAESWQSDCIFVGRRGQGFVKRLLSSSVSSTVASHAPCSVEVIHADKVALNAEALRLQNIEVSDQISHLFAHAA